MSSPRVEKFVSNLRQSRRNVPENTTQGTRKTQSESTIGNSSDLFDPDTLAKLGNLELISQNVVDGFLSGKHRSTHKGGYTEFSEYRPYAAGDDLRMLDWKLYAKSDRYYVRQYDDETNLQALLVLDGSGSMAFGRSTVSKWDYARMAASCLARLLLRQRDSAGLAISGQGLRNYLRPLPRANHLAQMLEVMAQSKAEGKTSLAETLLEIPQRLTRRGMVIVLSDCFGDPEVLRNAFEQIRLRGHDLLLFQVLAPEEITFPFRRASFFRDLELPRRLQVQPTAVRRQYLKQFNSFQDQLRQIVSDLAIDYQQLQTNQSLGDTLAEYLRRRGAKKPTQRARA
ncbi:MAG: DUF58 domain-containing protein [Lacipirellulaceae bacterium]